MRLENCCGTQAQIRRRFTPKWTSPPCTPWHCRGQEVVDESTPQGCARLPDNAPRLGLQAGQTCDRATGVRLIPGAKTLPAHYRQSGTGVGNTAYPPNILGVGGATQHRTQLRPALECDGSLDGSPAARSAALSAQTRSAILLFRSRDPNTAEGCQKPAFHRSAAALDLSLPVRVAGGHGPAIG